MIFTAVAFILAALVSTPAHEQIIAVDSRGVITDFPKQGLRVLEHPRVELIPPGLTEQLRIAYEVGRRQIRATTTPDDDDNSSFLPVRQDKSGEQWRVETSIKDLTLITDYRFLAPLQLVVTEVIFINRGQRRLKNLLYSREWRQSQGTHTVELGAVRWSIAQLRPGHAARRRFTFRAVQQDSPKPGFTAVELESAPFQIWTSPEYPTGINFGAATGLTFLDYDRDGFQDLFAFTSGHLWHNDAGKSWSLAHDLVDEGVLPPAESRYGSGAADFDGDGFPDLATAPRDFGELDTCFHLLHNTGRGSFVDLADDPDVLVTGLPCNVNAETCCWGDLNGDALLDLFLPVYPESANDGPGNLLFVNSGPQVAGGLPQFLEDSVAAGVKNPEGSKRPEGAQLLDVDADGDLDLYCNGHYYQNNSTAQAIRFDLLPPTHSGIALYDELDEGAMFFDYDMDGDFDLIVTYPQLPGVTIWENRGDATFFELEPGFIEAPDLVPDVTACAEDWDNDGDLDFINRFAFRRNELIETGTPTFTLLATDYDITETWFLLPSFADWDHDGDLDIGAGSWSGDGTFLENTLYDETTPFADQRFVRVKVVADSETVASGLETEFGAIAELHIDGETIRRRKFTSTSGGYLNQHEYSLHFGLPPDPDPDSAADLAFSLSVDFPTTQGSGTWRVDSHINPALCSMEFASLSAREITIFRSGAVLKNGVLHQPLETIAPTLFNTADGLIQATESSPIPELEPAPEPNYLVGLDFETRENANVRLAEIVVDGQLDALLSNGGCDSNVRIWDLTESGNTKLLTASTRLFHNELRNHRQTRPLDIVLEADHHYRIVVGVTQFRRTPISGPLNEELIRVRGGLAFRDDNPCSPETVVDQVPDPSFLPLALRYRLAEAGEWFDEGMATGSPFGVPKLAGSGSLVALEPVTLDLTNARPLTRAFLVVGFSALFGQVGQAVMVPSPDVIFDGFVTDRFGDLQVSMEWPPGMPPGTDVWFQWWLLDDSGPDGKTVSNGLRATTPK